MSTHCRIYRSDADARAAVDELLAVTSYQEGVPHVRLASHRNLKQLLVEAGLDPAAAEKDVAALHEGRILVLVRGSDAP